jgi:hypothetical protein
MQYWIPAFAGMTENMQADIADEHKKLDSRFRGIDDGFVRQQICET